MELLSPAATWSELGNRYYARRELPTTPGRGPEWASARGRSGSADGASVYGSNVGGSIVVGCPLAGPLALARDPNKIVMLGVGAASSRPCISIYAGGGAQLSVIDWSGRPRLRSMAWVRPQSAALVAVREDGGVEIFDEWGKSIGGGGGGARAADAEADAAGGGPPSAFMFGEEVSRNGIAKCCVWEGGVAVLTHHGQLWVAPFSSKRRAAAADDGLEPRGIALSRARMVARLEEEDTALGMCVWDRRGAGGELELLLSTASGHLVVAAATDGGRMRGAGGGADAEEDARFVSRRRTPDDLGPIAMLSLSPNMQFLAGVTEGGSVVVFSSNLSEYISRFDTATLGADAERPQQLAWCGNDSVLVYWDEVGVLMVGPQGDWIKYSCDEPAALVPEPDGVRVVTDARVEFIGRVPDETVSVFGIGSAEPGALLYQALEQYENFSASADESMRMIHGDGGEAEGSGRLAEAVNTCVGAALHEWDVGRQMSLMRAAAYGKVFLNSVVHAPAGAGAGAGPLEIDVREAVHLIRILNTVRDPAVGLPLSYSQLQALTTRALLARLAHAHHHLHAIRIAETLGSGGAAVIVHWACAKIRTSPDEDDATVLSVLVRFLRRYPSVSFAAIASHAYRSGRRRLAAMLLEYEKTASQQVPLLVRMGESEAALRKAIDCGEPDLVFMVLFSVMGERTFPEFVALLNEHPRARDLYVSYCRDTDPDLLVELLRATGGGAAQAEMLVQGAYADAFEGYREYVGSEDKQREARLKSSAGEMRLALERAIEAYGGAKETAFARRALEEAVRLHAPYSVSDAIRLAVKAGDIGLSLKIKADFKVPEKRYCWTRIRAHAAKRDWAALERFSREKFPSVGFMPFVEECVAAGAPEAETSKYIARIPDLSERAAAFEAAGMLKEAMETAEAAKNSTLLDRMRVGVAATTYSASQSLNVNNVSSTFEKSFSSLKEKMRKVTPFQG